MLDRNGYVYVLGPLDGYYKIGRAKNVSNRMKLVSPKLPFDVEVVLTIRAPNMMKLESYLHKFFAASRGNGEWFWLSTYDLLYLDAFKRLAEAEASSNPSTVGKAQRRLSIAIRNVEKFNQKRGKLPSSKRARFDKEQQELAADVANDLRRLYRDSSMDVRW